MSQASGLLKIYLRQLKDQGVERIGLSHGLKEALLTKESDQKFARSPLVSEVRSDALEKDGGRISLREALASASLADPTPTPIPQAQVSHDRPPIDRETILSKEEKLLELKCRFDRDQTIRSVQTLRGQGVFSTGSVDAEVMFIGEAPGAEEEKQQEPFVGPAGQTLTKILHAMGLRRQEVYISNICKFRPKIGDGISQGSKNRPPTKEEMDLCLSYIYEEIDLVKPKIIVALGATAANGIGIEGGVGALRGKMQMFRQIPVVVTYHPSYLLRKEQEDGGGVAEKRLVWEDMMTVMEYLGMPVSAKQRAYFSKRRA